MCSNEAFYYVLLPFGMLMWMFVSFVFYELVKWAYKDLKKTYWGDETK